jgi:hypothetical protein
MPGDPVRELVYRDSSGRSYVIESNGSEKRVLPDDRPVPPQTLLGALARVLFGKS